MVQKGDQKEKDMLACILFLKCDMEQNNKNVSLGIKCI